MSYRSIVNQEKPVESVQVALRHLCYVTQLKVPGFQGD